MKNKTVKNSINTIQNSKFDHINKDLNLQLKLKNIIENTMEYKMKKILDDILIEQQRFNDYASCKPIDTFERSYSLNLKIAMPNFN